MPFSWRNLLTGIPTDKRHDIFDRPTNNKRQSKQKNSNNHNIKNNRPSRHENNDDYYYKTSVEDLSAALGRTSLGLYDDPFSNYSRRDAPPYPPRHQVPSTGRVPSSSVHPAYSSYYDDYDYDPDYDHDYDAPPQPLHHPAIRPSASAPRLSAPRIANNDPYSYHQPYKAPVPERVSYRGHEDRRHSSIGLAPAQRPPPPTDVNNRRPRHNYSHSVSTYLPAPPVPRAPPRPPAEHYDRTNNLQHQYRSAHSSAPPTTHSNTRTPPRREEGIKPNQCHGTTASGKRCLRTVGPSDTNSSSPSKSPNRMPVHQQNPMSEHDSLGDHTRKKLDRMLSRKGGARGGRQRVVNLKPPYTLPPPPVFNLGGEAEHDNTNDENSSDEGEGEGMGLELAKFCHQHTKQALREEGTFAGRKGSWIRFDDWIPSNLPVETILQLRQEMTRPISSKDRVGYIYCHEMAITASDKSRRTTLIKLGRSVRPVARLSQWKIQCPSNRPIVRDIFPLHPSDPRNSRLGSRYHDDDGRNEETGASRLAGALSIAPQGCPHNFRWERLVLIEVAGRASIEMAMNSPGGDVNNSNKDDNKCVDCGKKHAEHFEVLKGSYERWIMSVILKWQAWVSTVLL